MEGLNSLSLNYSISNPIASQYYSPKASADATIIESIGNQADGSSTSLAVSSGIALTAKNIIEQLNELLKEQLPEGIYGLKAEDHTAEATSDRIVASVTALYHRFAEQRGEQDGSVTLAEFMEQVRSGVEKGYNEAFEILSALGAFEFDGVQSSIEKTKQLIDKKLNRFEEEMKNKLSPTEEPEQHATSKTNTGLLTVGGVSLLDVTA